MNSEEQNELQKQEKSYIEEKVEINEKLSLENFEPLYFNNYFTNNIIEQLTEISLKSPLKWFCPNKNCYYNENSFNEPLIEDLIDNSNILFICPKCKIKLYPCQNCLHFIKYDIEEEEDIKGYHCRKCGWFNIIEEELIEVLNLKSNIFFNIEQAVTVQCIISGKQYYEFMIQKFYKDISSNIPVDTDDNVLGRETTNSNKKLKLNNNSNNNNSNTKNNSNNNNKDNKDNNENNEINNNDENNEKINNNNENNENNNNDENNNDTNINANNNNNIQNHMNNNKKNYKKLHSNNLNKNNKNNKNDKKENNNDNNKDPVIVPSNREIIDNNIIISDDEENKNKNDVYKKDIKGKNPLKSNREENDDNNEKLELPNENDDQEVELNKNGNKYKRKRKRKRRTTYEILLSKLRTEFIFDHNDYTENKFEKSTILYIIKILQTPKIIFKTMDEIQKYRLLDMDNEKSLILNDNLFISNDFYVDSFIQNSITDSINLIKEQSNELNFVRSNLQFKKNFSSDHEPNKVERMVYGIDENQYDIAKKLLYGLYSINAVLNRILDEIESYIKNNAHLNTVKWMNISRSISSDEIKDLLKKYTSTFDDTMENIKSIPSSYGSIADIFSESYSSLNYCGEDRKGKDRVISNSLLSNSRFNSSGKSSIFSSNSSELCCSNHITRTKDEKYLINIKMYNQLRQLYATICQYILF